MLKITITPNYLHLEELTDELYRDLATEYTLENTGRGYRISGEPEKLYKVLLQLSYDYDIELV